MRFVGIDLAWGDRNTTGAVVLEWREAEENKASASLVALAHSDKLAGDDEILDFVRDADDGGGIVVGIDAPLDVPNETGERPVEAALRRCFGKYQAGAHPANRTRLGDDIRGERLARRLEAEQGIVNAYTFAPNDFAVRRCLEVFPHPAQVVLFRLAKTLKYKAKPGRDYASRWPEYARLVAGLRGLESADPALMPPDWLTDPTGLIGKALKQREDLLDALVCAYVAAYFWRWGDGNRAMVIGDKATGYIITPITPELRACVEAFFAASSSGSREDG